MLESIQQKPSPTESEALVGQKSDPCPVCDEPSHSSLVKIHGKYDSIYCTACQLQYSSPMSDPGWNFYKAYHQYEVRSQESDPAVGNEMASRDWRFRTFFSLSDGRANAALLDIGCGEGKFLALVRTKGFDVFGIDLDPRAIELAKTLRLLQNVRAGNWQSLMALNDWKNFDAVTLFDVLEHVASPVSLATAVYNVLKPGGNICVTVPRLDRFPGIFDKETDCSPHHLTLWTKQALHVLLDRVGFKEIRIVERPLMLEDFLLHAMWRSRRVFQSLRTRDAGRKEQAAAHTSRASTEASWQLVLRRIILDLCQPADWLLRKLRVGRGFTLLVYARKV